MFFGEKYARKKLHLNRYVDTILVLNLCDFCIINIYS